MLSRATAKRTVIAACVAAAVGASGAATASAATVTKTDDTAADFALGTPVNTVVRGADAAAGVELARTLEEQFDGALPASWTSTPWTPPDGAATVSGGAVLVDGTRLDTLVAGGQGSSLSFRATFGDQPFRHVGFATDYNAPPWAMFSTGPDGGGKLYARTSDGDAAGVDVDFLIPGVDATLPHNFRIDWTPTGFDYFIDDALLAVASHASSPPATMPVQASDYTFGAGGVSIDSIALNTHKPSGTFTSQKFDAGDARVTAAALTPTGSSTGISYETRTADTALGLDAASFAPLGAGGAVATPKRFVQYRATLTTATPATTPRIEKVDIAYTIDDEGPAVAIQGVAVDGHTATATFTVTGATGDSQCKLDSGAFAPCTSPKQYLGVPDGDHTITVQATDASNNVGNATKAFVVDTTAPAVTISGVAVTGASAKVSFGTNDATATTKCKLDGGAFAACASPAEFGGLAAGAHSVVVQATDTQGNVGSATRAFDVAAAPPTGGGGGTTPPGGGGGTKPPTGGDTTQPNVLVQGRSLKVSSSGVAKLRIRCPRSETSCAITVKVKKNGKRIARKTLTVSSGTTRTFRLQLSHAARTTLAARGKIKATAVITAVDAAGNSMTTTRRLTLRAPAV